MSHLKWLVVRDLNMIESATFWKDGPEIASGRAAHRGHRDRGVLPARRPPTSRRPARSPRPSGCCSGTTRRSQPPGDVPERAAVLLRAGPADPRDAGRLHRRARPPAARPDLGLPHSTTHGEPDAEAVLAEINGRHLTGDKAGQPLSAYTELKADGSTAGGCWIYTGVYADGINHAANRKPGREQDLTALDWGWAWPANRRILYNRASADPDGQPVERAQEATSGGTRSRAGGPVTTCPTSRPTRRRPAAPSPARGGPAALAGDDPFIMQADGKGWLFAPKGMLDGPLPTHYEPQESPVAQPALPAAVRTRRAWCSRARTTCGARRADAAGRRRLPVRLHHLPAHRAPHGRRDEPVAALPVGAAAGVLLRGLARSWPPSADWRTAGGPPSSRPARPSRPGCWSPSG